MAHFAKPAEGSWTEHYPELGTGPVVLRGLDLARALRARARGDLPPDVAERRPRRAAPQGRQLLHQGARRAPARRSSSCAARTARSAPSTTSAATAATSSCGTTSRARRRAAPAASSPASTTAGATTSRASCTFVQQESEFFDLDKADYGLAPVQAEVWEGFIFVNLDPDEHHVAARLPRRARARPRGLPVRRDDPGATSTGPRSGATGSSSSTRSPSSTTHPSCTRSRPSPRSRASSRATATRRSPTTSTVRTAWCRRGAACRRRRT